MHPTFAKFGSVEIPTFGVLMVIAFFAGLWLAQRRASKFGIDKEAVVDALIPILFAGVLGARIVYIALEWKYFSTHPEALWSLRFSGLTSFGGIIFGLAAAAVFCHFKKIPFLKFADLLAPSFLLGHAFGRVGCFFNGCCHGTACPVGFPLGVQFPGSPDLQHPAQLYDTAMNLIALFILLRWERKAHSTGQVFGFALMLHGAARYIYEFWRAGTQAEVDAGKASSSYLANFPITEAQAAALLVMIVGLAVMLAVNRPGYVQQEIPA